MNGRLIEESIELIFLKANHHVIPRMKISVSMDISVLGFYGYIGDISMNIFT